MAVATSTALLIAAGVAAGSSVASSKIQSNAAKDAAEKQQDATNQAFGLQQQVYRNTQQSLAPYSDLGTGALGNLRQLAGVPNPMTGSGSPNAVSAARSAAAVAPSSYTYNPASGITTYNGFNPQTGQITGTPPKITIGPGGVPVLSPTTQSGYVTMRAPDGSMQQVDPQHVDFYRQKGAQVVNG